MPHGAGAYPAMGSPFTLLGFPHRQHNDVAYLETFVKGEYVEDVELHRAVRAAVRAACGRSRSATGESLELIAEAAADL